MIENKIENLVKSEKILSQEKAKKKIAELKKQGKKVGLCHGGFDLLHPGHMLHFESAKKECDVLFVSITSDKFVSVRKGSGRPVYSEKLRAYSIAALDVVDYVVVTNFRKGTEIIEELKPSYYIKGPDYEKKQTPGITAEREAIKSVGGEIKYTKEPTMSTTGLINYIKEKVDDKKTLVIFDRDGTIIKNDSFFGKNKKWKDELEMNKTVVDFMIYLQTKFNTTFIVVTHQAGVARKYFTCKEVEKINKHIDRILKKSNIEIENWQYCPYVDALYAKKMTEIDFDPAFIQEQTERKPRATMVEKAMEELKKNLHDFSEIIVVGNDEVDEGLAVNLKAKYIDVTNKTYRDLVKEME